MKTVGIIFLGVVTLLASGCAPTAKSITQDKNFDLIEKAMNTPRPDNTQGGSLWNNTGSTMFTDPKAQAVGDLVTILVQENASATRSIGTKKSKKTGHKSGMSALLGFETSLSDKNPNFKPSTALDLSNEKSFDGSGETSNSDTLTASVAAIVTEVFPNGNMRVMGRRQVTINAQPQKLTFSGIIRAMDIAADNSIPSSKVAQAVVSYGGGGDLASVVHEGWLSQTLDTVWPF
ncbi:MAG: flagellar basal body L-ring protein FlgH [Mariprofundaceae bacterium]